MDSKQDLKEEIARVAYEIYEQMGISGREVEHWLEAERIVLERLSVRESSKAAKKLVPSRKKGGTKKKKMLDFKR
jgi:arginine/lysine/ornithine decarboxylase